MSSVVLCIDQYSIDMQMEWFVHGQAHGVIRETTRTHPIATRRTHRNEQSFFQESKRRNLARDR